MLKIDLSLDSSTSNLYLSDDYCVNLSPLFGASVQEDPTSTVEINLLRNGVFILSSWLTLPDLAFGSDFINGEIMGVIDSALLDPLPRVSNYQVVVRVTDSNGIQSTYNTFHRLALLAL